MLWEHFALNEVMPANRAEEEQTYPTPDGETEVKRRSSFDVEVEINSLVPFSTSLTC